MFSFTITSSTSNCIVLIKLRKLKIVGPIRFIVKPDVWVIRINIRHIVFLIPIPSQNCGKFNENNMMDFGDPLEVYNFSFYYIRIKFKRFHLDQGLDVVLWPKETMPYETDRPMIGF